MISLIVNGDDFGLSPGINRGIIEAFGRGILTRASVVANGRAFIQACELAERTALPVGLHLNLTHGRPVSPARQVSSLVNGRGWFLGKWLFVRRWLGGRIDPRHLSLELSAQIEKALASGLSLTHLDSHHHIHVLPNLNKIFRQLAFKYGIKKLRRITPPSWSGRLEKAWLEQLLLSFFGDSGRSKRDLVGTERFWGPELLAARDKTAALRRILRNLSPGTHELMCHPGYVTGDEDIGDYREARQEELAALCDQGVREIVRQRKIRLID